MGEGTFSLQSIKGLPNWVIENDSELMSWSFYDGIIEHRPNRLEKILKHYTYREDMYIEYKDAYIEEMNKLDYDSRNIGVALVEVDGREQLYVFPVNKAKYLLSSIEKTIGGEVELICSGYIDYDNA